MGRLSPVIPLALLATAHCDNPSSSTTTARSDQVIASGVASTVAPPQASAPAHVAAAVARPRKLCESDGDTKARSLPRTPASHAEAAGEPRLDGELPKAGG